MLIKPQASKMCNLHRLSLKPNNQNCTNTKNSNQGNIKIAKYDNNHGAKPAAKCHRIHAFWTRILMKTVLKQEREKQWLPQNVCGIKAT